MLGRNPQGSLLPPDDPQVQVEKQQTWRMLIPHASKVLIHLFWTGTILASALAIITSVWSPPLIIQILAVVLGPSAVGIFTGYRFWRYRKWAMGRIDSLEKQITDKESTIQSLTRSLENMRKPN
jgi:hypothetical protein